MASNTSGAETSALTKGIRDRRSVRSFLDKPVPEEMIREILSDSLWSPSWANTQPWEIYVVTGEPLERFKKKNRDSLLQGGTSAPDIPMPIDWPEALKRRRIELAQSIYESLSISREDADGRLKYYADMYYLFDAPAFVLFVIDRDLKLEYAMLDLGAFLQTFFLLAHDRGLGTCAFAGTVHSPEVVHGSLGIPDRKLLALGAALGWPDPQAPINNFERSRASLDEIVTWIK